MKFPYLMQTKTDCGPRVIHAVTGLEFDTIMSKWPGKWLSTDMGRFGAPNDTPWDHFVLLERLNLPYEILPALSELKHGDIVLIHRETDKLPSFIPVPRLIPNFIKKLFKAFYATLQQHWVVVDRVDNFQDIYLFMGDKPESTKMSWQDFKNTYHLGFPNCAYRIGSGTHKVKWWHRTVAKITGWMF